MRKSFLGLMIAASLVACERQPNQAPPVPAPQSQTLTIPPVEIFSKPTPTRAQLLEPLFARIKDEEDEMLPFDEPKTEFGQQDGSLRHEWEHAYFHGKWWYEFNGDRYGTLWKLKDGTLKPRPPQVCADFIVDTLNRTAGTWYKPSLRAPGIHKGRYDMREHAKSEGFDVRRVSELIDFFKQHPEDFQFVFDGAGPKLSESKKAKAWMKERNVQLGDIVIIRGKAPWDDGKEIHNHSMFVTGLDDEGRVKLVTGNPVWPITRKMEIEGARTPKRRIVYIIRLSDDFLGKITGLSPE